MPLYEYQCLTCGERREVLQRFADPPLEICPDCGGAMRKLVSAPAFHLKGSGWYATDYGGKAGAAGKTDEKAEGRAESKGDGKTEGKTESPGGGEKAAATAPAETTKAEKPAPSGSPSSGGQGV